MKRLFFMVALLSFGSAQAATSCGGTSQPRCEVNAAVDQQTTDTVNQQQTAITAALDQGKIALQGIPDDKFKWTFIPDIPTASCSNPQLQNPINSSTVEMDVCSSFNTFQTFINGVLAFFCILGCVQQIRAALAVRG